MDRPTKITFGEMRDMGVRGLLIYCADYRCSHSIAISGDSRPDDAGCPISRSGLCAKPAVSAAPTCGRISIGMGSREG